MNESYPTRTLSRSTLDTVAFGFLCFVATFVTRLAHLDAPPVYDELYHILAAQSWQEDGSLSIYQGSYERTPLYTFLTAWMFGLAGGTDLVMARLPNVVFGVLLATGAALWTRALAGRGAGWIVAALVLFWPSGIHLSQIVRFYALHGVLFFVGAIAVYELFRPDSGPMRRWAMLVLAAAALWLAKQFQDSTLVGVLALAVWVVACVGLPLARRHGRAREYKLAIAALFVLGLAVTGLSGMLGAFWDKYTMSPWGMDITLYHRVFSRFYPLLWPLTPVLGIAALCVFPRPAGFCVTLVAIGLVIHSFAGVQNIRYFYYLTPFLFALWAMGLCALLPFCIRMTRKAFAALPEPFNRSWPSRIVILFAVAFAILSQDAVSGAIKLMIGKPGAPFVQFHDWSAARTEVQRHARNGALVVATNELSAIHYLGGFDVVFSNNWIPEMNYEEFARDPRTGRPLISDTRSLGRLVDIYPEGIFIASIEWWSQWPRNNSVGRFMQAFEAPGVTTGMERVGPLWILHWTSDGAAQDDEGAAAIRGIVDPGKWTP